MLRLALSNFRRHKLRSVLTGFAVVLGVSFVAGTFMFTDSIDSTLDSVFSNVYEGVDVSVRPEESDLGAVSEGFDASVIDAVLAVEGVAAAEGSVAGLPQLVDPDGELIGGQGPPTLGFSWVEDEELNALQIREGNGRSPTNDSEIVIDVNTANVNELSVGDTIGVLANGPARDYTIVGLATFGEAESLAGAVIVAFEQRHAQEIFDLEGQFSIIDVRGNGDLTQEELRGRVAAALPEGVEAVTGEAQANEQLEEISVGLGFLTTALLAFAGVSVFVGSFTIQNTFRIIVAQRIKELALLRALGASRLQVLRLVVLEAFVIGLLASVLGIIGGVAISYGVRGLLDAIGFGLPSGPIELAPRTVYVSFAVGVGVTVLAALLPAIKASRVAPMEALRDSASVVKRKALVTRGIIGLLMIIAGGGLLLLGLGDNDLANPIYYVGAGAFVQFIGVSVMAPLLSVPIANGFGWILGKTRGVVGQVAARNAARTPRRTAATAAALTIGVSLIAFVSILATSFKVVIDDIVADTLTADVIIYNPAVGEAGPGTAGFPESAIDQVENIDGVKDVTVTRIAIGGFQIQEDTGQRVLLSIDPETYEAAYQKLDVREGDIAQLEGSSVLINQLKLESLGKQVGDTITIRYPGTEVEYSIVGSFDEEADSDYLIANEEYLNYFDNTVSTAGVAFVDDGSSVEVKEEIKMELEAYPQITVNDQDDLIEEARTAIDQALGLLWGLLAMAVISAVFGITNTLLLSISERTREIGLLRAVGMTRPQLRSMIRYESVVIALFGSILGLIMGVFFAWAVIDALRSTEIERLRVVISYGQLVAYFLLATLAGVIAAIWPARKAAKMDVLKAISYE